VVSGRDKIEEIQVLPSSLSSFGRTTIFSEAFRRCDASDSPEATGVRNVRENC